MEPCKLDNKYIALDSIKNEPTMLQYVYVSERLQDDKDIVMIGYSIWTRIIGI